MSAETVPFTAVWTEPSKGRQSLICMDGDVRAGYIDLGIKKVAKDPAWVNVDMVDVEDKEPYRGGVVSTWLVDAVVAHWPEAALIGGPLSQDDDPGPSFRLRTWERGIPFHDAHCELQTNGIIEPSNACSCHDRLLETVPELDAAYRSKTTP